MTFKIQLCKEEPRPVIDVKLIDLQGHLWPIDKVLVDTGSARSYFTWDIGEEMKIEMTTKNSKGKPLEMHWRGGTFKVGVAIVTMQIESAEGHKFKWRCRVGFTQAPLQNNLLGIGEALDYFQTRLETSSNEMSIEPTNSYPGTIQFPGIQL